MSDFVTAYRNGKQQRFTRRSWEVMGTDKYGWALVPDAPKEVSRLVTFTTSTSPQPAQVIEQTFPQSTPAPKKRKKSNP
jgi:hypothetical protein